MGSGASKTEEVVVEEAEEEVDNYNDLYTDQRDEEVVDVPEDAFPSLQNSRFWQAKSPAEPEVDPETNKLLPKPYVYDEKFVADLMEKTVKTEVDDNLLTSSLETLVDSLTFGCETEPEKVLTFYRWIKNVETSIPSANDSHAAYYFAKLAKEPIALLELFQKLCKVCSIECEILRGHAKGASFAKSLGDPSYKFKEPNHHWLAVAMEQRWHFIDLTWCVQQATDFYFLCEPAIFVYNHLPVDPKWQLLVRPVARREFPDMAFLHKSFYHHELELQSHQNCTIKSATGEEVIRIGYKEEMIWSYRIICEKSGTIVTSLAGVPLDRCVMIEAYEGKARFNVRMPNAYKYRLDLFCQDPEYTATAPSLFTTYIIHAQKGLANFEPFPTLDSKIWGPTQETLKHGLIAKSHKRGRVMETAFDLEQCVIDSYNSEEKEVSVNVLLPQTGLYKLMIYLEPEKEGAEKLYIVSYLLECVKPFSQRLVFQNYGDKLGVQSMKKVLQEATRTKNLHKLRAAVALMKTNELVDKVAEDAVLAEDMLVKMEQIDEMKQAIEQTDRGTMSEMRNYSKPPRAVHDVLIATLLLLGDHEDAVKMWTDVQSRCSNLSKLSMSKRIRAFNILYVHHEISRRSMDILEKHDVNELQGVSPGAALFYSWALSVNMEVLNRVDHNVKVEPANVKRQKEIFGMIAKGTWPVIQNVPVPEVTPGSS
ncbi:kyphoscoliosis peptidase-like isoform X2 [Watersipora subatra]|uniref:kyphoscoliosis peptidase-like isoform X2 n=1 Tax=Watersipora subatra TaxID=2589382 RepID=UPI00355B91AB